MTSARSEERRRARGRLLLRVAVVAMALLAAAKLSDELLRLVWRTRPSAAVDLKLRHAEVHAWFEGRPVYRESPQWAAYPPATFPILWPLLGWLPLQPARFLWAATAIVALAWMARLIVQASGATDRWQRVLAALLLLAMNQTGVALGNGQLILHVLPVLVAGLLLIHRGGGTWTEDLAAAACVVVALVKITITVPFLWLVLFAPAPNDTGRAAGWRLRPAVLVAAGYVALTVFAAAFQDAGLPTQLREWLAVARRQPELGGDYANIHTWLRSAGLDALMILTSVVLFLGLGLWLHRHRNVDLWIRLGITGLIARFWTYHRLYDDVLVVLALVALFRLLTGATPGSGLAPLHGVVGDSRPPSRSRQLATGLMAATMLMMLLPARLGTAGSFQRMIFNGSHTITWLGVLVFLGWWATADRSRSRLDRPAASPVLSSQPSP